MKESLLLYPRNVVYIYDRGVLFVRTKPFYYVYVQLSFFEKFLFMKLNVAVLQKALLLLAVLFTFQLSSNSIGLNGLAVNNPGHAILPGNSSSISSKEKSPVTYNTSMNKENLNNEEGPFSVLQNAVGEEVSTENTTDALMAFGLVTFLQVILILLSPVIVPRIIKAVKL